ncbi:MAG: hypothetical protein ACI9V9_000785, partial [Oleispira sp.]
KSAAGGDFISSYSNSCHGVGFKLKSQSYN